MKVKKVKAKEIRKLRHRSLRQGKPFSSTSYDKDEEETTFHLACIEEERIITCSTFYPQKTKEITSKKAYRLRGMATEEKFRGLGHGKKNMKEAFKILQEKGCDLLWCNARLIAVEFYKSIGFKTKGKIFNIEGIGPHYYMYKKIN